METFSRDGMRFDVRDGGPVDDLEPIVLLHGFPQQPSGFAAVARLLQASGRRTLIPSQRGYLASARPKARRAYGAAETAADVVALLDAAGLARVHLVGHDWGGAQAWTVAGTHPDRVASLTVLSTPHPGAMARSWVRSSQALKSWYMALFQLPVLPEVLSGRTLAKTLADSGLPDHHVTEYAEAMTAAGALTGALNWYRGMPFGFLRPLGPITVPTSYVWGRHDFALGRAAAELTRRFVTGPYRFVELDAGHWLPETEPEQIAELIMERATGPDLT